ncbi:MAG: ribosomal RNA small subunit methyltransferase A [Bryobacterales bacterium]|nr:ribosomal RNA small subunit methyltransferase A [Bryobacterales bacterium]
MSRQKLGQHFLRSSPVLARIVSALGAQPTDTILEIGPGKGALTGLLLEAGLRVEAIEVDPTMVEHLETTWPPGTSALRVHCQDVLEADLTHWGTVTVAGNLPYYITSPILRRLFQMGASLRRAVLLMQLEVAERLVAKPGSRDYGFLSVLTQMHAKPELLFRVPPGAFHIPPKVQSAVVRLNPHRETPSVDEHFVEFVGNCFAQKRKMLRNNLKGHFAATSLDGLPEGKLRAEQLSLEELRGLWERLRRLDGSDTGTTAI